MPSNNPLFFKDMVVNHKLRPHIPPSWMTANAGLCELSSTIRDCWDQDAEARLSASNVTERIKALRELQLLPQEEEEGANVSNEQGGDNSATSLEAEQSLNATGDTGGVVGRGGSGLGVPEEHELTPLIINGHAHLRNALPDA